MATSFELPIIDLGPYLNPISLDDKQQVIAQVRDACRKYGFFGVRNHGVPMQSQLALIDSIRNVMSLPKEEKMAMSFLKNVSRRGYEGSGDSMRDGDALPDSKESFYIGREEPVVEPPGFHGPNVWPNLPEEKFRGPVWEYYGETTMLGKTIWEILLQGLGHSADLLKDFARKPVVMMKMIRYPPLSKTKPGQFGVGAHTDFGGVTVLLQQPGRDGLEVWYEGEWVQVPAIEDVMVINMGDMIQKWSGGEYTSAKHRVINKSDAERISCATFWHGDLQTTNPLNPNDPSKETVGQLLVKRFKNQFSLQREPAYVEAQ